MTPDDIIAELDATCRAYTSLMHAAVRLQLQIKAHESSIKKWSHGKEEALIALYTTGVTPHLHEAIAVLLKPKRYYERQISTLTRQLPIWGAWAEKIRGIGPLGLGLLIGQIGDLHDYANPAKVWKRMGLAVMPDGRAQRRMTGVQGQAQGFSPTRRALMHVLGDALIKQNKQPDGSDGEYREVYVTRKAYEVARTAPIIITVRDADGHVRLADHTAGICHQRAMRYMEKRLLRNLWRAWRGAVTR